MSRWLGWCTSWCVDDPCTSHGAPREVIRRARAEAKRMTLREAALSIGAIELGQDPGWTLCWASAGLLDAGGAPSGHEHDVRLAAFWRIRQASQRARRRMARRLGLRPVMWREVQP